MFPADSLPPTYFEDRAAAAEQTRRSNISTAPTSTPFQTLPTSTPAHQQRPKLTTAQTSPHLQAPHSTPAATRPSLSRGTSSGFLGTVYQGFLKSHSACSTPPTGGSYTPTKFLQKKAANQGVEADALKEALMQEKRRMGAHSMQGREREEKTRDADICSFPSW